MARWEQRSAEKHVDGPIRATRRASSTPEPPRNGRPPKARESQVRLSNAVRSGSFRRCATTTLVSSRTLRAVFIDLLAAFLDNSFQLVGFFRRERSGCAGENRLALFIAHPLEPVHEVGGHFQPGGRQRLQILDDVFER